MKQKGSPPFYGFIRNNETLLILKDFLQCCFDAQNGVKALCHKACIGVSCGIRNNFKNSRNIFEFPIVKKHNRVYDYLALCKITKLALVGYQSLAHTVRLMGFFCMRNLSMRSHISMAKLEGDTFECAGDLESQSTNPFQLCHHNYLVVIGRASIYSLGAHSHA